MKDYNKYVVLSAYFSQEWDTVDVVAIWLPDLIRVFNFLDTPQGVSLYQNHMVERVHFQGSVVSKNLPEELEGVLDFYKKPYYLATDDEVENWPDPEVIVDNGFMDALMDLHSTYVYARATAMHSVGQVGSRNSINKKLLNEILNTI